MASLCFPSVQLHHQPPYSRRVIDERTVVKYDVYSDLRSVTRIKHTTVGSTRENEFDDYRCVNTLKRNIKSRNPLAEKVLIVEERKLKIEFVEISNLIRCLCRRLSKVCVPYVQVAECRRQSSKVAK